MNVEVEGPATYAGVRVNHPRIVEYIRNMAKRGRTVGDICRVVGMPQEVVQREIRAMKAEAEETAKT